MATAFNTRKRIRRFFGHIESVAPMPNLIEVQKSSYEGFLQRDDAGGQAHPVGPAGGLPGGVPDQGLRRARQPRVREVRVRRAQVRRRGVPAARHHLCRAAQGDAAARGLGHRRGSRLALDPRHQGAGCLHGRHAAHDRQRHLHRQRHRARHRQPDAPLAGRLLRPRQGQDPQLGQVPVRRPHHPLSRLVARLRVRRQGPDPCPHRPPPQDPGDDAAARARQRRDLEEARRRHRQEPDARSVGGPGPVAGGDPRRRSTARSSTSATRTAGTPPFDAESMQRREAHPRPGRTPRPASRWPTPAPR